MKIKEYLILDCRDKGNLKKLVKKVSEIPFIEEISEEYLTKTLARIQTRYHVKISFITLPSEKANFYSFYLCSTKGKENNPLDVINSITYYEGLLKSTLRIYCVIKKDKKKGKKKNES